MKIDVFKSVKTTSGKPAVLLKIFDNKEGANLGVHNQKVVIKHKKINLHKAVTDEQFQK